MSAHNPLPSPAESNGLPRTSPRAPWSVVVFAARESLEVLERTLETARIAAHGLAAIDVLVNGNPALAATLAARLAEKAGADPADSPRVWSIPLGDKANAWNQYIHHIWSGESIAFFMDGYVRLNSNAVRLLGEAVAADGVAMGGTGVPGNERTAEDARQQIAADGGFQGNFCCLKGSTMVELRRRNIRLPIGLYRVDALMGAFLNFGLEPQTLRWNTARILAHAGASWQTDAKHWWKLADVRAKIKRSFRQSRGDLENQAARNHMSVRKQPLENLPHTASELVLEWVNRCPAEANAVLRHSPLAWQALKYFKAGSAPPEDDVLPRLLRSAEFIKN